MKVEDDEVYRFIKLKCKSCKYGYYPRSDGSVDSIYPEREEDLYFYACYYPIHWNSAGAGFKENYVLVDLVQIAKCQLLQQYRIYI